MEIFKLEQEVKVFCATTISFPDSIQETYSNLERLLIREGRTFYGLSYKNPAGNIVYKAAVTENFEGEGEKYGFETFIIPSGNYLTKTIKDWKKNPAIIGTSFDQLLADTRLDPSFPCMEWYRGIQEVMCMVKLRESTN